jgi:hypothetical protein
MSHLRTVAVRALPIQVLRVDQGMGRFPTRSSSRPLADPYEQSVSKP